MFANTDEANAVCIVSYTIVPFRAMVPSGLDFEAAGSSVARYYLSNYLLRGCRVAVNRT